MLDSRDNAEVAELVDALDSKSYSFRTTFYNSITYDNGLRTIASHYGELPYGPISVVREMRYTVTVA